MLYDALTFPTHDLAKQFLKTKQVGPSKIQKQFRTARVRRNLRMHNKTMTYYTITTHKMGCVCNHCPVLRTDGSFQ